VTAAVGVVVLGAAPAWAYYTTAGTGTGDVQLGHLHTLTSSGTASGLYPGGAVDVALTIDNTGGPALTLQNVALDTTRAILISNAAGCTMPAVSISFAGSIPIPANASTTLTLPHAATMGTTSQNACQGGPFRIPVTVTAVQ
jgi:hypothetical protein